MPFPLLLLALLTASRTPAPDVPTAPSLDGRGQVAVDPAPISEGSNGSAAAETQEGDAAAPPTRSAHAAQMAELERNPPPVTEDQREAAVLEAVGALPSFDARGAAVEHPLREDSVVFGYIQNEAQVYHLRWHALTHVASRFVGFDSAGNLTSLSAFTGRSSYLKAGGAAEAAGVKVVLTLASFSDGNGGTIATVMTSASRRANLVAQLANVMATDSYAHGVSLDLEFSWGSSVRDGITAFCAELRQALDAVRPGLEISVYVGAIHRSSQWNFDAQNGLTPHIDHCLYSMYDWASGSTPRAISNYGECVSPGRMYDYCDAGLPPEKLVPVISAYSRRWSNTSSYGSAGSNPQSGGFTDGRYDTTLRPGVGPNAYRYERGPEAAWYTYNLSGTQYVRTFDSLEAMAVEVRQAVAADDPTGQWSGRRLGGVGFWSLFWMAETTSVDMHTGGEVSRTRTYPHVYQMVQDAFARPGDLRRDLETFAGLDFRWRDPNESPDTVGDTNGDSSRALDAEAPTPGGRGRGMRFTFDFEGSGTNRAVLAHEILAHPSYPTLRDTNAVLGHVALGRRLVCSFRTDTPAPGYVARLLVVDANRQIEAGPAVDLGSAGVHELRWALANNAQATGFATSEPGLLPGNGVVNSGGGNDIGVFGVVVEGDGAAVGVIVLDDLYHEPARPVAGRYVINELRIDDPAQEFVEVFGPAGQLPFGLVLRTLRAHDGAVTRTFGLSGFVADAGRGKGFFVAGDPAVANVSTSVGFGAAVDDLSNAAPSAVQLYDAVNDVVLDTVLYGGFGGAQDLVRIETQGAASHGPAWLGGIADGRDESGALYAVGRVPDGRDTRVNGRDFGALRATPGGPNRSELAVPFTLDFEAFDTPLLQTYDVVRRVQPGLSALPASPSGGAAWRVVDIAGGGVCAFVGDRTLGKTRGLDVAMEVYVPRPTDPAQAFGIGVGDGQGTTFFTNSPRTSGYESGLWLVYENRPGVQLADGRLDHGGVWELLHVTHDNQDAEIAVALGGLPDVFAGVTPGTWTEVRFVLRPDGAGGDGLVVSVGGSEVYRGPRPAGVEAHGALQFGFRENHSGAPGTAEGLWVDGLRVRHAVERSDGSETER